MQVFICWSSATSHPTAQALHRFLGDVIQDLKQFLSRKAQYRCSRLLDIVV